MSYFEISQMFIFLTACLTDVKKPKIVMTGVHINSNINVSLFRVKTFRATITHFCNVDSNLPSKDFLCESLANLIFFPNSVEIKLFSLPVSNIIVELSDFVLDKLLTIAVAVCNKVTFSV